jgi:hypothetical protein
MNVSDPVDPLSLGLALSRAFERTKVPYALGGALAYGVWAVPRGTVDVDINAFVHEPELPGVFEALDSLGIGYDPVEATRASRDTGLFVVRHSGFRIDVFTPSIPFSWEALRTRVTVAIDGQDYWFLSAEALSVFKLLFFRGKDLVDLERLVAVQGNRLDRAYVRQQIAEIMGEDDERTRAWDRIVGATGS